MNLSQAASVAIIDLKAGFERRPLWQFMARRELTLRYARSFIGPFWITLSMAIWVTALSFLYGGLFGANVAEVAPYVALGVITWTFMGSLFNEATGILSGSKGYSLQMEVPVTTFLWLIFFRNVLVTCHHMVIFIGMVVIFGLWPNENWLYLLFGIPVLLLACFGIALFLAVLTPRFRDIAPLTANLMSIGFFLSPVMWRPADLQKNEFIAAFNPFTHLLQIFRMPLLGEAPETLSLIAAPVIAVVALLAGLLALGLNKKRINYWL